MRLIDADKITEYCTDKSDNTSKTHMFVEFMACIYDMPTIDIVRCKDCKYFEPNEICSVYSGTCWHCEMVKKFNDYCSYGER